VQLSHLYLRPHLESVDRCSKLSVSSSALHFATSSGLAGWLTGATVGVEVVCWPAGDAGVLVGLKVDVGVAQACPGVLTPAKVDAGWSAIGVSQLIGVSNVP
jgi:hypothetical protein